MTAGEGAAARARGLGLRTTEVDGNDAEAVVEAAGEITARIRETRTPEFLHARTYRQHGHTYFDPATYRPEGEADRVRAENDPIGRQRAVLEGAGVGAADMDAIRSDAQAEMIRRAGGRDRRAVARGRDGVRRRAGRGLARAGGILMPRMTYAQAAREALAEAMREDRACLGRWRGPGQGRRLPAVQGAPRRVRGRPDLGRPDIRGRDNGRGVRGCAGRHAAGRGDAVRGLRALCDGRAGQPGRQGALHVRRPVARADGDPQARWGCGGRRRPSIQPVAGELVYAHSRPGSSAVPERRRTTIP